MSLTELQQAFIDYLVTGDDQLARYVVNQGSVDAETRLHIYGNAYRQRLRETIDNDHPMLGVYLGDELFEKMAGGYISQYPSSTYSLRYFAENLPDFLRQAAPFCEHPVISELAGFERKLLDVFDAPATDCMTLDDLRARPQESWPTMTLRFHPSVQLFECHWNSVEIWQALKQEQLPPDARADSERNWLLWRNQARLSEFTSLSDWQKAMLEAALAGHAFAELCDLLLEFVSEQEVSKLALQALTQWISAGVVARLN